VEEIRIDENIVNEEMEKQKGSNGDHVLKCGEQTKMHKPFNGRYDSATIRVHVIHY